MCTIKSIQKVSFIIKQHALAISIFLSQTVHWQNIIKPSLGKSFPFSYNLNHWIKRANKWWLFHSLQNPYYGGDTRIALDHRPYYTRDDPNVGSPLGRSKWRNLQSSYRRFCCPGGRQSQHGRPGIPRVRNALRTAEKQKMIKKLNTESAS